MRTIIRSALFASTILTFGGLASVDALAEDVKLSDLLNQGYEIKDATVIDEAIARRVGGDSWKDGFLLTLQLGNNIAFCHYTLAGTVTAVDSFKGGTCYLIK